MNICARKSWTKKLLMYRQTYYKDEHIVSLVTLLSQFVVANLNFKEENSEEIQKYNIIIITINYANNSFFSHNY